MSAPWLGELERLLGAGRVVTDADVTAAHARDQAGLVPAGTPACLVRARSVDDVVQTLKLADEHLVAVVTRGAGTGLAGGANAVDGCIILDVSGMDRVLEIDPVARTATVEPGVINADLVAAVAEHGLWYAPDPASRAISSIGGNIATNAGGACCLKYGVTGDHVAGLTVVVPGGRIVRTGARTAKDVAGLDLTRLLIGSEGTLGVIVAATVRLLPTPAPPATLVASFPTLATAGAAIVALQAQPDLSLVEFMDRTTVRAVEAHIRMGLDTDAEALVLVQSDSLRAAADVAACETLCAEHGASFVAATDDPVEGEQFLHARRMALPALESRGAVLLDDVAVPVERIPDLLRAVDVIADDHDLVIGTFGHAGDGNVHPTIVFDPTDTDSEARARAAFVAIVRAAVEMGGTITGEHGVGLLKRDLLEEVADPTALALMQGIRRVFDPNGILNPGRGY